MTQATPSPTPSGVISRLLGAANVPYADAIGDALVFVIVLVVTYALGRTVVLPALGRFLEVREVDAHVRLPLRRLTWGVVGLLGLSVAVALAGWNDFLTSLAAVAAAGTLAVGIALQDVIRNLVAGVFIFTDRPFRIGDWIEWEDNAGVVEDISLRVTRVRTFDNELLTVPNAILSEQVIKNPVAKDSLRIRFTFGIGYGDDAERAIELILAAAADHPDVLAVPEPSVILVDLGDSAVGLEARVWIADPSRSDFLQVRSEWVADVKARFDEAGIDIPFPQREISGGLAVGGGAGGTSLGDEPAGTG